MPKLTNDCAGVGFVWSQPSASTKTVYHRDEYAAETFSTLQLTPTVRFQPDLSSSGTRPSTRTGALTVVQAQFILVW